MKTLKIYSFTALVAVVCLMSSVNVTAQNTKVERPIPPLNYTYNALEPYIDSTTMYIHYNKHYMGYYQKFLKATEGTPYESQSMETIFANISKADAALHNNAGGYYNHKMFWEILSPKSGQPSDELKKAIESQFQSFDKFKETFSQAATSVFGSGWAWLIVTADGKLVITSTANQDNPLMDVATVKGIPILNLDVWEHAYYLKYQNKRPDYIAAFWNVVNWEEVSKRYAAAIKK
jgi:superoxide dismutase, Fe-Mn family